MSPALRAGRKQRSMLAGDVLERDVTDDVLGGVGRMPAKARTFWSRSKPTLMTRDAIGEPSLACSVWKPTSLTAVMWAVALNASPRWMNVTIWSGVETPSTGQSGASRAGQRVRDRVVLTIASRVPNVPPLSTLIRKDGGQVWPFFGQLQVAGDLERLRDALDRSARQAPRRWLPRTGGRWRSACRG